MLRTAVLLLMLGLSLCLASVLGAEEEGGAAPAATTLRDRVEAWLKDLKDDSFRVREAARAGLAREGLRARDLLEAASEDPDAEVRRTVDAILARIPGAARRPAAEVRPGAFHELGLLSLNLEQVSAEEAFQVLGSEMRAHFQLPAGSKAKTLSLKLSAKPCWLALDRLLKAAGLAMPAPFNGDGLGRLQVRTPADAAIPRAALGPVRVSVQEVSATRVFGREAAPRYLVKLRLDWAPFVQLVRHETPSIESAFDPDGKVFLPAPGQNRPMRRGVGRQARSTLIDLAFIPGKEGCKPTLSVLEFTVPVDLRYDLAEVRLDDTSRIPVALDTKGKRAGRGQDESVVFQSLQAPEEGQRQWIAEYAAHLSASVAQSTLHGYVLEADGRQTQLYVAGGRSRNAEGTVRVTARAYRSKTEPPAAMVVRWFRREEAGTLRFRLEDIPLR